MAQTELGGKKETMDAASSRLKKNETICLVQQLSSLMSLGCISAYGWVACSSGKVLEQHTVCFHPDKVFFREGLACFSKTVLNCILHLLQQYGFILEESCLQSRPFTSENIRHIMT